MCCALVLELGVLISGGRQKVESGMWVKECKGRKEGVTGQSVTGQSVMEWKAEA